MTTEFVKVCILLVPKEIRLQRKRLLAGAATQALQIHMINNVTYFQTITTMISNITVSKTVHVQPSL